MSKSIDITQLKMIFKAPSHPAIANFLAKNLMRKNTNKIIKIKKSHAKVGLGCMAVMPCSIE